MLLVQNVPDDKQAERAMVEQAVARYLQSGGRVKHIASRRSSDAFPFNGHRSSGAHNRKALGDLDAKMKAAMPELVRRHRTGAAISHLAKDMRTTVPTVKRYLLEAGEDPHANIKNHDVSHEQILAVREMVWGGSSISDIAKWTGLSVERTRWTIKEFQFKKR